MHFTGTLIDLDDQKSMEHILQVAIRRTCSLWNGMFLLWWPWLVNVPPGKYLLNDHVSKWP